MAKAKVSRQQLLADLRKILLPAYISTPFMEERINNTGTQTLKRILEYSKEQFSQTNKTTSRGSKKRRKTS